MKLVDLVRNPIEPDPLYRALSADHVGAIATFMGMVKGRTEQGRVERIDFEADEAMALTQMEKLRNEALERFELHQAALVHRLGLLEVGDLIVLAAASAPHRSEALAGAKWLIDELKAKVPIWKREHTPQGDRWVNAPQAGGGQ